MLQKIFKNVYSCLAGLYIKSGLKNIGCVFLMTDAQVAEERFLVLINDLLASGEIPELLADDEIENIINGVRGEVRHTNEPRHISIYLSFESHRGDVS